MDRGGQALLACPALRQLENLVVSYHNCSLEVLAQFRSLPLKMVEGEIYEQYDEGAETYEEWWTIYVSQQFHL
jgi:hypothetical protein